MSIAVEDWDDLDDARRRRGGRKAEDGPAAVDPTVTPRLTSPLRETAAVAAALRISAAAEATGWETLEPAPAPARSEAPEPESERVLGLAQFEDDDYGEVTESLRAPAGLAIVNWLVWIVGVVGGVVECTGVAFFVSIGLLLAAYLTREAQRDRTSLILLAGAIPLPLTIAGLFF